VHFRIRIVPAERLGALGEEERIVLAPDREQRRMVGAEYAWNFGYSATLLA
jgi:hypothetical protein